MLFCIMQFCITSVLYQIAPPQARGRTHKRRRRDGARNENYVRNNSRCGDVLRGESRQGGIAARTDDDFEKLKKKGNENERIIH